MPPRSNYPIQHISRSLIACLTILVFASCSQRKNDRALTINDGELVPLRYAEGFSITKGQSWTLIEVKQPFPGATKPYVYLLAPEGEELPDHTSETRVIRTPIESVVCTSTTHIPLLDYLDLTDFLVGFPTTDYISSEKARRRVDAGLVRDLGVDKGLNFELLASLQPDLVMGYSMSADYGQFKKMEQFGIPVVLNAEYLEKHPLGRAEWIRFVAAFFGKEREADSVFHMIERNYLQTADLAADVGRRPTVLSGIVYGDAWFLPGGQNYASRILADAGCDYLWKNDSSSGYLELSFESIYEKANNADIWIGVGPFSTLDELKAGDHRYAKFRPFSTRSIYNYDARKGAKGGNEYLELGYLRPDIILQDLVKIAHPDLLPDHQLFFHRKLQ